MCVCVCVYVYIYIYIYIVKINGFYFTLLASANWMLFCICREIALRPPASLSHRVERAVERSVRDHHVALKCSVFSYARFQKTLG